MATSKKIILWVLGIAVVVVAILYTIGVNVPRIEMWQVEKQGEIYEKQVQEELNKYKNDFDGGKTPEETLELYITALKAGDIEKASKYYEIEFQYERFLDLKNELQKYGNLDLSIDYINEVQEKGTKNCGTDYNGDWCMFKYVYTEIATTTYDVKGTNQKIIVPPGEKTTESVGLGVNKYTGVWKISQ